MPTSLGPAEILVILVVALIVLGPERLPKAARQIGKAVAEVRHWSGGIQDEVRNAFNTDEVRDVFNADPQPSPAPEPRTAPQPGSFGGARSTDATGPPHGPTPG